MSDDWDPFADPTDTAEGGGSQPTKEAKAGKDFNPYEMLNIAFDATDAAIKSAFRKASLKVHPDHCPDDPDAAMKFRALVGAKDFLLDPLKRRIYNLQHGFAQKTGVMIWWSDWDTILNEIDPAGADDDTDNAPGKLEVPTSPTSRVDILILGATGVTGTLACATLCSHGPGRTWAITGRDSRKLQLLETKFGSCTSFRGFHCVASDEDTECLIAAATVVVDLRGPKSQVGMAAARTCISAGVHYIDVASQATDLISIKASRDALDSDAKSAGVSLVFGCGWHGAFKDLALWSLVKHVRDTYGSSTRRVDIYHVYSFGYLPGTSLQTFAEGPKSFAEVSVHGAPFPLGGVRPAGVRDEDNPEDQPVLHERYGMWLKTCQDDNEAWIMRWSCALFDTCHPYGENFLVKSWDMCGTDKQTAVGGICNDRFVKRSYRKYIDEKKIVPPGSGPKERIRKESHCTNIFIAEAEANADDVSWEGDKAYGIQNVGPGGVGDLCEGTALIAIEAAYCILEARDRPQCMLRSGFGTASYHLAHLGFWDRLLAIPGVSWHMAEGAPDRALLRNAMTSSLCVAD